MTQIQQLPRTPARRAATAGKALGAVAMVLLGGFAAFWVTFFLAFSTDACYRPSDGLLCQASYGWVTDLSGFGPPLIALGLAVLMYVKPRWTPACMAAGFTVPVVLALSCLGFLVRG
ncbi:hypothetical protein BIV57_18335 [Mangrovactinospora gilvigrisea]|uniref:Uncharacterized protein n=1 Tax=Mangrovactinospora gilvigrisea TaxID=1428644 RepID=A0A1J7BRK0_9ACTN|nr:hypothetical protein [Mangrovactinospora gilvigrisea]OIV36065.1 hypothetical protein BIV57_18335 [Mangrovactinospora gilvigrisea]